MSKFEQMQLEQEIFWRLISFPNGIKDALDSFEFSLDQLLLNHAHISKEEALSIYANAYFQRIFDVAQDLYPCLLHYLGEEDFAILWKEYLHKHPPHAHSLRKVGNNLVKFLSLESKYQTKQALIEIAIFEWHLLNLIDQPDEASFEPNSLSNTNPNQWADLKFKIKSDWALFSTKFSILEYWQEIEKQQSQEAKIFELDSILNLLIWREDNSIHFKEISAEQQLFLSEILQEKSFGEICLTFAEQYGEALAPEKAIQMLLQSQIHLKSF